MILIGENIHIISKKVRAALESRDEKFVIDLINQQQNLDYVDLNVGPAKNQLEGILPWLTSLVEKNSDLKISFDTTNFEEMKKGLSSRLKSKNSIINSTSADCEKLDRLSDLALETNSSLVCLTMNKEIGIPAECDGRLELAFEIYEKCLEKGLDSQRLFFDPLILPVSVNQKACVEALNTIKMIKESFDPIANTVIGLSNVSNGSPVEMRPLINRVFATLAYGCGLDSAIIDGNDDKLINMFKMLESQSPKNSEDKLLLDLAEMMRDFSDIEDIKFEKEDENIIKCAKILLNKDIYSHSFTQV